MNLNLDYKTIQDEEKINRLRHEYINTKFSADSELKKQEKMQGYLLWFFIILGTLIGWWLVVLLLVYVFNGEFDRFTIICALFIGLPIGAGPINWAFQRFPPVASLESKLDNAKQLFRKEFDEEVERITSFYRMQKAFWYSLNGREFEEQITEMYVLLGYNAELSNKGADGGVDIILHKNNKNIAVQFKAYKGHKVTLPIVRDLYGVLHSGGYDEGHIVTLEGLTKPAIEFCQSIYDKKIKIITIDEIFQMVHVKEKKQI